MNEPSQWARVRQLFHDALDAPPDERMSLVRSRTADPDVLAEVESLFAAYPYAEGFLDQSADPAQARQACADLRGGERLGVFEIVELIGAGGMGEVYRARDTRLDRDVAIKVLPRESGDAGGRRQALEREARAVAKLTHARISTLHDVGYACVRGADVAYLVMELVEGETLAARLSRGPLPLGQCLNVACDIAEGLVAAHAAGIVHRDLKPGNVMLTKAGAKLLDFGIAIARVPGPPPDTPLAFGTPSFMSPEQLRGDAVDPRSDLFAFGAMLYEMLSGQRAFSGESPDKIAAAVMETEPPPLMMHVNHVPSALERVVSTCLAKDPDERWQTARDLLRELRWIQDDRARRDAPQSKAISTRIAVVGAAIIAAVVAVAVAGLPYGSVGDRNLVSFSVYPAADTSLPRGTADMALSPYGARLVFVAISSNGVPQLWLRNFATVDPRLIQGTDGASGPFWSPDGHSIAFFAKERLKRIAEAGGLPQDICEARGGVKGGSWSRDGTILFGAIRQGVMRVPAAGGVPRAATVLANGHLRHAWPVFLADGRNFVYLAVSTEPGQSAIYQARLDTTEVRRVQPAESRIGVTANQLVSLSNGQLQARPYDWQRAQISDASITIARDIQQDIPLRSGGAFAITAGGVVAFRNSSPNSRLIWFDRQGRRIGEYPERADYHHPWLSPDETRVATEMTDPATGKHTIWILDLARGITTRLLSDPTGAHGPIWSPDGTRVSFASNRLGGVDLFEIAADGRDREHLVLSSHDTLHATDWSQDGRRLLYSTGRGDMFVLPLAPGAKSEPFLETTASERQGQFTPDARWIAYVSDESGLAQIYVRRLAGGGSRRVSIAGGAQPRWRADGKELFYLAPDGTLMAAAVHRTAEAIEIAPPAALFNTGVTTGHLDRRNQYLVSRDGQRVLVNLSEEDENAAPITVVVNWDATRPLPETAITSPRRESRRRPY